VARLHDVKALKHTRFLLVVVAAAVLVLGACGDDDEPASNESVPDVVDDQGPAIDEVDLVVPREYLQGEWCDSDGQGWSIEGSTARFDDGAGGAGEIPIDLLFIDDVENELVSQTDDEFVAILAGDEITFVRGSC
jgi:hypothetical protein